MKPLKRPDPIHDELSDEAKMELAVEFAALRTHYGKDFHAQWRAYEKLRNAYLSQSFHLEHEV